MYIVYVFLSISGHTIQNATQFCKFDHETTENIIKRILLFQEKTDLESCGCLQDKLLSFIRNS